MHFFIAINASWLFSIFAKKTNFCWHDKWQLNDFRTSYHYLHIHRNHNIITLYVKCIHKYTAPGSYAHLTKAKLFKEVTFFIITFTIPEVDIQVQNDHRVLDRLVTCIKTWYKPAENSMVILDLYIYIRQVKIMIKKKSCFMKLFGFTCIKVAEIICSLFFVASVVLVFQNKGERRRQLNLRQSW